MNGVQYVKNAALDLKSVGRWFEIRDAIDDTRAQPEGTPRDFWPIMMAYKLVDNNERDIRTYADVVTTLGDEVYSAPYLPDALVENQAVIHFDTIRRTAHELQLDKTMGKRAFSHFIWLLCDEGNWERIENYEACQSVAQKQRSGTVFMSRPALQKAVDILDSSDGPSYERISLIGHTILAELDEDRQYHDLVFGV